MKLLEQLRREIRVRHYSIRTEHTYVDWVRRYVLFHHKRHPKDMGPREVNEFLSYLATDCNVAASTQNPRKRLRLTRLPICGKKVIEVEIARRTDSFDSLGIGALIRS